MNEAVVTVDDKATWKALADRFDALALDGNDGSAITTDDSGRAQGAFHNLLCLAFDDGCIDGRFESSTYCDARRDKAGKLVAWDDLLAARRYVNDLCRELGIPAVVIGGSRQNMQNTARIALGVFLQWCERLRIDPYTGLAPKPVHLKTPDAGAPFSTVRKYGLVNRPAGYAHCPDGWRRVIASCMDFNHGIIAYDRPLTPAEMYRYELTPVYETKAHAVKVLFAAMSTVDVVDTMKDDIEHAIEVANPHWPPHTVIRQMAETVWNSLKVRVLGQFKADELYEEVCKVAGVRLAKGAK